MRTSRICLILLSILVVQISSSEVTELDKLINKIKSTALETAVAPFKNVLNEIQTNPDINNFLKNYVNRVRDTMEETQKVLLNLLPIEERAKKEKLIGYLSLYASAAFSKVAKGVTYVTNTSFDTLPDDIKTKLFDLGNDINSSLLKIKNTIESDSKTSQKNPK